MLVRCPGCSVAREVDRELAVSNPDAVSTCTNCGYTHAISAELSAAPRERLNSIPGARARLDGATEDLFRFSGNPGPSASIPVDTGPSLRPARRSEPAPTSARKPEASIMFSLEELMKAGPVNAPAREEQAPNHLWSMQAATPIFGTEQDLALLTAPVVAAQTSSMDSMTMPSRKPAARRWLPLVGGGATLVALASVAWWTLGSSSAESVAAAAAVSGVAAAASGPVEPAAVPAPSAPAEPAVPSAAPSAVPAPVEGAPADPAVVAEAPADEKAESEDASKPSSGKGRKKPAARPSSSAAKAAFNTGAAKAALSTAAAKAAGCAGTSGKGKVQLTFATTGRVSSAQIIEGPFAGKPGGACALRHFKAARVPAFSGSPQTVAKSFKIP